MRRFHPKEDGCQPGPASDRQLRRCTCSSAARTPRGCPPPTPAARRRAPKEPRCPPGGPRAEPALTAPTPPALRRALPVQGRLSVTTGRTCSFWAISAPARPERGRGVVSRGCLSRTSNSGEQVRRSVGLLWAPRLWRATPPLQDPVCVSFPHGALTHRPRRCPRRHLAVPAPCPLRPGAGGWCSRRCSGPLRARPAPRVSFAPCRPLSPHFSPGIRLIVRFS